MEGLWYMHFTAGTVEGDGLAVLRNGEILGGDQACIYAGSYREDGKLLYANVRISPYSRSKVPPGIKHPISIFLQGTVMDNTASVSGHADNAPGVEVAVELHRAA
jgi:hypothetical protein